MSESLVSQLLAHASAQPGDAAIVDERQTVSYGELARRVLGAAARLRAAGVRPGETLALSFGELGDRAVDSLAVLYGAGYVGAAVLPLYPDVPMGRKRELAQIFGAHRAVSARTEDLGLPTLGLDEICDKSHSFPAEVSPAWTPGLPFFYQFSSGTVGIPKVVLFTHAQFYGLAASLVGHYGWNASDRLLPAVRAPGKVGLRYFFRTLFAGGALVNLPFPETRQQLAHLVSASGVTVAGASPWQLRRLLATRPAATNAPRLRMLESIGAPIAPAEIDAIRVGITSGLYVNYSSTESGLVATLRPGDPANAGYTLVDGMQVEILDEAGAPLPAESPGTIRLRAPWIPQGYARNAAETAKRFRDGWFYPGDAGSVDADGRLRVRGRSDSTINYGGMKIIPEEVEAVLMAHPGVTDAVVTSVPDALAGEIPVAFVVLSPPATLEALKLFCEARLDAAAIPVLILSLEQMPRSADGKVERARLKEHARSLTHMLHSTKP